MKSIKKSRSIAKSRNTAKSSPKPKPVLAIKSKVKPILASKPNLSKKYTHEPLPGSFASIKKSFYDPEFYKKIPGFSFWKVATYLLLIVTLAYLLLLGKGGVWLHQNREHIEKTASQILSSYPEGLELNFNQGVLSTNAQEPVFFSSEGMDLNLEEWDLPSDLAVIDTQTPFSPAQFEAYGTIAWLSGETLYMQGEGGKMEIFPYPNELTTQVTKASLNSTLEQAWLALKLPAFFFAFALFILCGLGFFLYFTVYLAFISLIVTFISRLNGLKRKYAECYRLTVYALTPALFFALIINVISLFWPLVTPPFLFTGVLLLALYLNVRKPTTLEK